MIVTALVALVVAGFLIWKKKMPKVTTWLLLIAGAGATVGWIGQITGGVVGWLTNFGNAITQSAAGQAVPWVIAVPVLLNVVHDLLPKGVANRTTMVCAFFLPALAALLPGPIGEAVRTAIGGLAGMSATAVANVVSG